MSLITGKFFIFLCILLLAYYLLPNKKYQWIILLSGSLFFYTYASPYYLIFMVISSFSTYNLGLKIASSDDKSERKRHVIIAVLINAGILFVLKYTVLLFDIASSLFKITVPEVNFILPLGISFYTFMVISYIVDVYKGEIEPEKNYLKYLLYVCYFPQIIEGPINRYSHMKENLYSEHSFNFIKCRNASYRILIGLFKKVVIAGRFGVYVDRVFDNVQGYNGLTLLLATVFYVVQLYADFSGCMDLVIGISNLFGIEMAENFNLPLFSENVSEFWRRWHITLGAWFRDYIYYPVFRSEFSKKVKSIFSKTKLKKHSMNIVAAVSLFSVWSLTGLWHGAAVHYVVWGLYYAVILIAGVFLANDFKKWKRKLNITKDTKWFKVFSIIRTLIIVTFGELIFRANNMADVAYVIKKTITDFSLSFSSISNAILPFTEDNTAIAYGGVAIICELCFIITEYFSYKGKDTFRKHKYANALILIVATLLFGVFGESGFLYMAY